MVLPDDMVLFSELLVGVDLGLEEERKGLSGFEISELVDAVLFE